MKKTLPLVLFVIGLVVLSVLPVVAEAAPPGPPSKCGGKGQPACLPTAQLGITNGQTITSPDPLTRGEPMTYTVVIANEAGSKLDANDAVFELPFQGQQQFVSFSSTNSNWKLREPAINPANNTVYVDLGKVQPGEGGTITIKATFAPNYDRAIYFNTIYLTWNDEFQSRRKGLNVVAQINNPLPGAPAPVPDPPTPGPQPVVGLPGQPISGPFAPVAYSGTPNTASQWYFPATRHTLHGAFLNYWLNHGSLVVLGYPTSEEFNDNGRVIQYFERVVMEFWPENQLPYTVLLRSLGRELSQLEAPLANGTAAPSVGAVFYGETGHWLDGRFAAAWQGGGGLAQYGFPLGEAQVVNGKLIQWTERARFELDLSRPQQLVMLGLVGNESAHNKGYY